MEISLNDKKCSCGYPIVEITQRKMNLAKIGCEQIHKCPICGSLHVIAITQVYEWIQIPTADALVQ